MTDQKYLVDFDYIYYTNPFFDLLDFGDLFGFRYGWRYNMPQAEIYFDEEE